MTRTCTTHSRGAASYEKEPPLASSPFPPIVSPLRSVETAPRRGTQSLSVHQTFRTEPSRLLARGWGEQTPARCTAGERGRGEKESATHHRIVADLALLWRNAKTGGVTLRKVIHLACRGRSPLEQGNTEFSAARAIDYNMSTNHNKRSCSCRVPKVLSRCG